jgi:hypothetical protein
MTLVVVGLDAADYRLAKRWDCENILLSSHTPFTSESHSIEVPATLEVWPSIATGLSPDEHGVLLDPTDRSSRSLPLTVASLALQLLPEATRKKIVSVKENKVGSRKPQTDATTMFQDGTVKNWPGITPCHDWEEEGKWFSALNNGDLSEDEFIQRYLTHVGEEIGWAAGAERAGYPVAGIHIHYLDHMGHIFAERPTELKKAYEVVDEFLGWLRTRVDELLILSDHGMQTTETDDDRPGVHSWHALSATTVDDPPESVYEVKNWVQSRIQADSVTLTDGEIDAPEEHLRDLGYI